ncbi:hypothetical protein PGB90_008690 [Kerria lacca]
MELKKSFVFIFAIFVTFEMTQFGESASRKDGALGSRDGSFSADGPDIESRIDYSRTFDFKPSFKLPPLGGLGPGGLGPGGLGPGGLGPGGLGTGGLGAGGLGAGGLGTGGFAPGYRT